MCSECTADVRLAFQECVTTFADAAMQFHDGCAGLDSDPKDSECFAPVMGPVKECLAKFNMRCADEEAAEGFYTILRQHTLDADCLSVDSLLAGMVESLQQTDDTNYTTLHNSLESLSDQKSPAVIAAVELVVREMRMKSLNVATDLMASLVRPAVAALSTSQALALSQAQAEAREEAQEQERAQAQAQAQVQAFRAPKNKRMRKQEDIQLCTKRNRSTPAPQNLGSLECDDNPPLDSLCETGPEINLSRLFGSPLDAFAAGPSADRSLLRVASLTRPAEQRHRRRVVPAVVMEVA